MLRILLISKYKLRLNAYASGPYHCLKAMSGVYSETLTPKDVPSGPPVFKSQGRVDRKINQERIIPNEA